jgi:SAM-dependent methyltransferase
VASPASRVLDPDVEAFVLAALPAPPARVLEVGAGCGELANALTAAGYDVVAIDPRSDGPPVVAVALHELEAAPASFDAAVAVVSMHHVEPLAESCAWLAELVRPGGRLVLDELDVDRFDEGAAGWWLAQRAESDDARTPADVVAYLHHHCHPLRVLRETLGEWFALGDPVRGPYLYRWDMPPGVRATEESAIAAAGLPAIGARLVGTRR